MRDLAQEQLLKELLALRPELERRGVTHAVLIGSRARRDNRPDSDVDLAIEVDEGRKFSLIDLSGVTLAIEDALGLPTQVLMLRSLSEDVMAEVNRDRVQVF